MKRQEWMRISALAALSLLMLAIVSCGSGQPAQTAKAGPEPNFSTDSPYVSIEQLKQEYDQGANMIILDARPPQDYEMDHITGAISMPYFDVEQHYNELPRDTWIVAYCACPRAEAEHAADILKQNGFTMVKVLYDGYFEWLARDFPISQGNQT